MTALEPHWIDRALGRLRGEGLAAQLVRGAAGTGGLGLANKALALLGAIVLGRALGAEGYGYYAFALAVIGFIGVPAQLGLPQLAMREIAASHARSEWGVMRGLRRRVAQIAGATVVAGVVVGGGGMLLVGERFAAFDSATFQVALLLLPLSVGFAVTGSLLCGLRRVVQGTWPSSLLQPALFVLLVFLLAQGMNPARAAALNAGSFAVGLAVTIWLLHRYWPREAGEAAPEYRTRAWVASLLPFTLLTGISLINQKIDVMMLGAFASASDVGVYHVAAQGALLVSFPLTACNAVLAPNVARLRALGDLRQMQRLMTMSTLAISCAAAIAALVLMLAGRWLLEGLFGEEFGRAYPALAILAAGQLFNACAGSVGLFLSMSGHEKDALKGLTAAAVLNFALNAALIPPFGIVGAAIATAISMVTWNVLLGMMLYRRLGLVAGPIGDWLARRGIPAERP